MRLTVNGRFRQLEPGGYRTYASEVASRWPDAEIIEPPATWAKGWRGRLWEQTVLAWRARGSILVSLTGTGPWLHRRHLCVVHDLFGVTHPDMFEARYRRLLRFVVWVMKISPARFATPSLAVRDTLAALGVDEPDRIVVAPPGVDPHFFAVAAERDVAAGAPTVLAVNSNIPRKGGALAVAALGVLAERSASLRLAAFGNDGPERLFGALPRPENDRVADHGSISQRELLDLFGDARVLVCTSRAEGFGMTPLEALAAGVSVVTTSVPSVAAYPHPLCVTVADDASPDAVADAVESLLGRDRPSVSSDALPAWSDTERILRDHAAR